MAFSNLAAGASCGPSNPLQQFGKQLGQDRSTQFDRYANGSSAQPSSSSSAFRSSPNLQNGTRTPQQEGFQPMSGSHVQPLDLAPLHSALPSMNMAGRSAHAQAHQPDFEASFQISRLPQQHQHMRAGVAGPSVANNAWSNDFLSASTSNLQTRDQAISPGAQHYTARPYQGYQPRFGPAQPMFRPAPMDVAQQSEVQRGKARILPDTSANEKVWNEAFTAFDAQGQAIQPQQLPPEQEQVRPETTPFEADELAKTAGKLVSSVEHDATEKFRSSVFLNLMKKLRDHQAGIQGKDIVEDETPSILPAEMSNQVTARREAWLKDLSHKPFEELSSVEHDALVDAAAREGQDPRELYGWPNSKAADTNWLHDMWKEEDERSARIEEKARQEAAAQTAFLGDGGDTAARMREDDIEAREFAKYQNLGTSVYGAQSRLQSSWEEDIDEASREDFVGRRWEGTKGRGVPGAQAAEWDKLQADWDAFEAGPNGLKSSLATTFTASNVPSYQFQENNPYLQTTRTHSLHSTDVSADILSILESEAAVQQDPTDSQAWYNLGVKQQENERETSAIAALHRALQINPLMKEAWLALAVSYTNESDMPALYESMERWIDSSDQYSGVIAAHRAAHADDRLLRPRSRRSSSASSGHSGIFNRFADRHDRIVSTLLAMARHGSSTSQVDADVQVALGILFNVDEHFSKAVDCFSAAIASRPEDWLLYNRLGAVLSNSGRPEEALHYFRYALELKPEFARCHFNLAITCLHLKMHQEAASHCFTALTLQQVDARQQARQHSPGESSSLSSSSRKAAGDENHSLWETLRQALELMGRHELAERTRKRDIELFDLADFASEDETGMGGIAPGGGGGGGQDQEFDYDDEYTW